MTLLYFKSTFETHDIAALKIGHHVGEVTGRSVMPNSHRHTRHDKTVLCVVSGVAV